MSYEMDNDTNYNETVFIIKKDSILQSVIEEHRKEIC